MSSGLCDVPAAGIVYWPGREPLYMCVIHLVMAKRVAEAMGFYLHVQGIEILDEWPACQHQRESEEPEIDDEPPPDYGPPGTGAIITEWP